MSIDIHRIVDESIASILKRAEKPIAMTIIAFVPILIVSIIEVIYDARAVIIFLFALFGLIGGLKRSAFFTSLGFISGILETALGVARLVIFVVYKTPYLGTIGFTTLIIGISTMSTSYVLMEEFSKRVIRRRARILEKPNTEYAIEVIDVYKDYVVGPIVVHALRGVSLKVKRGEFVAIMGPSGSGKSTLLNLLGALDKPTKGKILIDGIDISKLSDDELAEFRNKKIGFIFQAYNLINRTKVLRNVEMPSIVAGIPKKERIEKAKKLLKIVGLDESTFNRRPIYLSGGQQQRVAIARALMNDPTIILADEPTGNLDSKTGKEVMNYLRMLNEKLGVTIVVVTHDRSVAEMADRILHIKDGKIVKEEVLRVKK